MKYIRIISLPLSIVISLLLMSCSGESKSVSAVGSKSAMVSEHKTLSVLYDFEDKQVSDDIRFANATGKIVQGKRPDSFALQVKMQSKDNGYTGFEIIPNEPWNWSELSDFSLAMDLSNDGEVSTQIYLDVQDGDGAVYTRTISVPTGGVSTYYAKMDGHDLGTPDGDANIELNFESGLRSNPPTWSGYDDKIFVSMWGKKHLNLKAITRISFSVQSALRDKELTVDNIRLIKNPLLEDNFLVGIVDRYGQNAKLDFSGKIHSDEELTLQRKEELSILGDGVLLEDRGKYSGWQNGPKLEATGYFRTEKVNGKWSFVTPDGYPYFATGIDIIRLANSTTMTGYDFDQNLIQKRTEDDTTPEDSVGLNRVPDRAVPSRSLYLKERSDMFEWLPSYDEPLGKHYGYRRESHSGPMKQGEVYSFYSANLERKYGEIGDYMEVWKDVTVKRMMNWGFTSLGNWTDPIFYENQRVPFFANGWIVGDFKTVSSGNDFWAPLPDVFDPLFEERAMITAAQVAKEVGDNPWCVGVFIDNEKSFGRPETNESRLGIVIHTLRRDGEDVPTKAEFTRLMKAKYGDIRSLNKAWKKSLESWDDFNDGMDSSLKTETQLLDYSSLLFAYANKYFAIVDKSLNEYLPNHLYLGARFPDWGMPIEVVKASAKHVDVISFNSYKEGLPKHAWGFLEDIDMPCIIGEFHMGSSDSGLFHPGLIHASSQEDRGRMFKEYMHSVIDNPYFVGAHWFQYIDSPITGRAHDGENYNVGFVTVTDVPYEPMVKAARELNTELYERRFGE